MVPKKLSTLITILLALILNLSDESSDLTMSLYLYQDGYLSEALIVLLTDYTGILGTKQQKDGFHIADDLKTCEKIPDPPLNSQK